MLVGLWRVALLNWQRGLVYVRRRAMPEGWRRRNRCWRRRRHRCWRSRLSPRFGRRIGCCRCEGEMVGGRGKRKRWQGRGASRRAVRRALSRSLAKDQEERGGVEGRAGLCGRRRDGRRGDGRGTVVLLICAPHRAHSRRIQDAGPRRLVRRRLFPTRCLRHLTSGLPRRSLARCRDLFCAELAPAVRGCDGVECFKRLRGGRCWRCRLPRAVALPLCARRQARAACLLHTRLCVPRVLFGAAQAKVHGRVSAGWWVGVRGRGPLLRRGRCPSIIDPQSDRLAGLPRGDPPRHRGRGSSGGRRGGGWSDGLRRSSPRLRIRRGPSIVHAESRRLADLSRGHAPLQSGRGRARIVGGFLALWGGHRVITAVEWRHSTSWL